MLIESIWDKKPGLMNVWLDDLRPAPEGYHRMTTAVNCIHHLALAHQMGWEVNHLSLDHDLGEDDSDNGYRVVLWIEEKVATDSSYVPPNRITVHSDNASARQKMLLGVESIKRMYDRRR